MIDENLTTEVDIAIVGGGMVGSTLAHLLADLPVRVALIDRNDFNSRSVLTGKSESEFDPRVSALTEASKLLFEKMGVWQAMTALRVSPYCDMQVWDADGTGVIDFNASEIGVAELGHIVENSVILSSLHAGFSQVSNLQLISGLEITELVQADNAVTLTSKSNHTVKASLLVAADGANSKLRKLANYSTREWDYQHHAIVTTVECEKPHKQRALQRFMETGPLAFLPLRNSCNSEAQNHCSIVWSCLPKMAEKLFALDEQEFNRELERAIEFKLGTIKNSAARFSVPLKQMHATSYVKNNMVLVGDAAHSIHPLAGQGVNLGFLDVAALAEELIAACSKGRAVADPIVLGRYERKRKGHNLSTMWMMEGFKHLFAEDTLPVRWIRNLGLNTLNDLPVFKNQLAKQAMGLK